MMRWRVLGSVWLGVVSLLFIACGGSDGEGGPADVRPDALVPADSSAVDAPAGPDVWPDAGVADDAVRHDAPALPDLAPDLPLALPDVPPDLPTAPEDTVAPPDFGPVEDTGSESDTSSPEDVGPTACSGATAELALFDQRASKRHRGLVPLDVTLTAPVVAPLTVSATWQGSDGASHAAHLLAEDGTPAATLRAAPAGVRTALAWDSATDLPGSDAEGTLTLWQDCPDGTRVLLGELALSVGNDPDRSRVVLVTHATNGQDTVSEVLLLRDGRLFDGAPTWPDLTVAPRPIEVAYAPDGGLALIVSDYGGLALATVAEPPDQIAGAPPVAVIDRRTDDTRAWQRAVFRRDGRAIYLLDGNPGPEAGLFLLPLVAGRGGPPGLGNPIRIAPFRVPTLLQVHPSGAPLFVVDIPEELLEVSAVRAHAVRPDGTTIATVDVPSDLLTGRSALAEGAHLLLADLWAGSVSVVHFTGDALTLGPVLALSAPWDVHAYPGGRVLVSSYEENGVTHAVAGDGYATLELEELFGGIPLAAEMDVVTDGPLAGLTLVGGLSEVYVLDVGPDGVVRGPVLDLGEGLEAMTEAVAVQP